MRAEEDLSLQIPYGPVEGEPYRTEQDRTAPVLKPLTAGTPLAAPVANSRTALWASAPSPSCGEAPAGTIELAPSAGQSLGGTIAPDLSSSPAVPAAGLAPAGTYALAPSAGSALAGTSGTSPSTGLAPAGAYVLAPSAVQAPGGT